MSELRGIGLDICGIARMAQQLDNTHFLQRILTKEEIAYLRLSLIHISEPTRPY